MTDPIEQLDAISAMISEARDAVSGGEYIDLTEIQGLVQEVCEAIQNDPPTDGGQAHEKIVAMIESLNALAADLQNQQKETGADIIRKAARRSYTKNQDES